MYAILKLNKIGQNKVYTWVSKPQVCAWCKAFNIDGRECTTHVACVPRPSTFVNGTTNAAVDHLFLFGGCPERTSYTT